MEIEVTETPSPDEGSHRCNLCRLPLAPLRLCVCAYAPRLTTATRVSLIIHVREWRRLSNTGRLVNMALAHSDVRLHGVRDALPHAAEAGLDGSAPETLVLFPGRRARPLTPELRDALQRPATLVVPDGNWTQTSHMMTRLPALSRARVVEVPPSAAGLSLLRRNVHEGRMSTYEAVALAMGVLEGEAVAEQMLDFFRRFVDRMLMLRGKIKANEIYGGLA